MRTFGGVAQGLEQGSFKPCGRVRVPGRPPLLAVAPIGAGPNENDERKLEDDLDRRNACGTTLVIILVRIQAIERWLSHKVCPPPDPASSTVGEDAGLWSRKSRFDPCSGYHLKQVRGAKNLVGSIKFGFQMLRRKPSQ